MAARYTKQRLQNERQQHPDQEQPPDLLNQCGFATGLIIDAIEVEPVKEASDLRAGNNRCHVFRLAAIDRQQLLVVPIHARVLGVSM